MVSESAARVLCAEALQAVEDLARLGVQFDADRRGRYALGLEGGHSRRRIVHAGGAATGRRLIRQLSALVAEDRRIEVLEGQRATALLTADGRCCGVSLADGERLLSAATIVATGGAAALWATDDEPRRRDRRRAAAGVQCGCRSGRPGDDAVSPHRRRGD